MNSWSEPISLPRPLRNVVLKSDAENEIKNPAQPAEEQLQASYERGRLDAEKALGEQLLKQRTEVHDLLEGALAALRDAVPQVIRDTESVMTSLALSVAQKIVADLPISAPIIEAAIRDALSQVEGTAQFTIRLHPADLELLQNTDSAILNSTDGTSEFHFVASPEVTRGGCIVQTRFGTVDARRETKMDLLKRSLLP
jgi:flagellar assembly protein FliH